MSQKKLTQKEIIVELLRMRAEHYPGEWVASYELQKTETPWGWLGTSADRRARELAEAGVIERKEIGKYAHYRVINAAQTQLFS